jgi:hypothetical protein
MGGVVARAAWMRAATAGPPLGERLHVRVSLVVALQMLFLAVVLRWEPGDMICRSKAVID